MIVPVPNATFRPNSLTWLKVPAPKVSSIAAAAATLDFLQRRIGRSPHARPESMSD